MLCCEIFVLLFKGNMTLRPPVDSNDATNWRRSSLRCEYGNSLAFSGVSLALILRLSTRIVRAESEVIAQKSRWTRCKPWSCSLMICFRPCVMDAWSEMNFCQSGGVVYLYAARFWNGSAWNWFCKAENRRGGPNGVLSHRSRAAHLRSRVLKGGANASRSQDSDNVAEEWGNWFLTVLSEIGGF